MNEKKSVFPGCLLYILAGLLIGLVLKLFIVDIQKVSGTSMEPSIHDGDRVVISWIHYGFSLPMQDELLVQWRKPEKGDTVFFWIHGKPVIKRCIATEHEQLAFSNDSGYSMTVGGTSIPLTEQQYQRLKYSTEVPEGTFLAIGDNHATSVDSRDYGFVTVNSVLGKVLCR